VALENEIQLRVIFTPMKIRFLPLLKKIFYKLRNRYIFTITAFIVWLSFFDRNDFFSQYSYRQKLNNLLSEKEYYLAEIESDKQAIHSLVSDMKSLEKFAREEFFMKKDDEDVFVIVQAEPEKEDKLPR
jgi:cell division protein FtsB